MSNQQNQDQRFLPFNFTSVAPFDSIAAALGELPTPQLSEPAGRFSSFGDNAIPNAAPDRAMQTEMLHLMCKTARNGYVLPLLIVV